MASDSIAQAVLDGRSLTGLATVVDIHGHGGPWHNFWIPASDPDSMVRLMDRLGVRALVLAPHLAISSGADDGNDLAVAWTRRYPGRLLGYATLYPHDGQRVRGQLERALDNGLVAIKLHPSVHRRSVADEPYRQAWEVARERGSFILSHTWHADPYCAPGLFAPYAEEYPEVPIVLGHSGGAPAGFSEAIELATKHENIFLDTTGSNVTGPWIRRMVGEAGVHKVLYGSDMPFIDPRYGLGKVALSGLSDEQLRMVMGLNALRLLARAGVHVD